jgi:hypothetical protein
MKRPSTPPSEFNKGEISLYNRSPSVDVTGSHKERQERTLKRKNTHHSHSSNASPYLKKITKKLPSPENEKHNAS